MLMFHGVVFSLDGTREVCAISSEMKCLGQAEWEEEVKESCCAPKWGGRGLSRG